MGRKAKDNSTVANPGRSIRMKRDRLGWTLDKLAEQSKVSKGSLSRIENGFQNYTRETIEKIAKALQCEFYELFPSPAQEVFDDLQRKPQSEAQRILDIIRKKDPT